MQHNEMTAILPTLLHPSTSSLLTIYFPENFFIFHATKICSRSIHILIFLHFSHVLTLITLLTACGVQYFKFENILHIGSESFRKLIKVFNWEQLILWDAHSTGYNHFQKMLKFTGRNKPAENTEIRRLTKFAIVVILELW